MARVRVAALNRLTRRGLLTAAAATVVAGRLSVPVPTAARAQTPQTALTDTQRSTYASVVEAVALLPGVAAEADRRDYALEFFETEYQRAPEHVQTGLGKALDLIDHAAANRFAAMSARERLDLLKEKASTSGRDPALEPDRVTERTAVAVIAERAAEPFYGVSSDRRCPLVIL